MYEKGRKIATRPWEQPMRSSAIAAAGTAGLIVSLSTLSVPALQFDHRRPYDIWRVDVEAMALYPLQTNTIKKCTAKFGAQVCEPKIRTVLAHLTIPVRTEFERCVANAWLKFRCSASARSAIEELSLASTIAGIEFDIAKQKAEAARLRAAEEARKQAEIEADRRQSVEVMGTDDGRSYLLNVYNQRIASAERECREHPNLIRVMQLHVDAQPEDYRVINRVREACYAIMRKQPFVIRPDGRASIIGYPIPPFTQIDYWGRSRCSEKGREAWRCIMQSAEALRNGQPYWGELDHEVSAVLRSIVTARQPPGPIQRR